MEIKTYANLLWRWSWLIALAALLGGLLAYVVSLQLPPAYESAATVAVARRSAADSEFTAVSDRPVATYFELLRKRPVLETVINDLQLDVQPQELDRQLRVSVLRNTSMIVLTVTDTDPERAAAIANEIVNLVSQRGRELLGNDVTIRRYSLHILDPARAPTRPVSPNIPLNVAVLAVVSAMLAMGAVLLIEHFDDRVRSVEEINRLVGMPALATIPQQGWTQTRGKPVAASDSFSPAVESYRMLRAHIEHVSESRSIHSLLVTSATDREGKSTTIANLAVVLAQAGKRVILVDTDLRKPTLHTIFQQPNTRGVTTALQSEGEGVSSNLVPTGIPNLQLMPSGPLPANPAELVGSPQMAALIDRLEAHADIVLLDSPALLPVVDPVSLARLCDATVLVARAGAVRAESLVDARERFAQFGIEPLGVVLNAVKAPRRRAYSHQQSAPKPAALASGLIADRSADPGYQDRSVSS